MKKFLGKLPVLIISIVLCTFFLVIILMIACRPVNYNLTYSANLTQEQFVEMGLASELTDMGITDAKVKASIEFKTKEKLNMRIKMKTDAVGRAINLDMLVTMWYYREGDKVTILGPTSAFSQADYEEAVKNLVWDNVDYSKISALKINEPLTSSTLVFTNHQAIAIIVVNTIFAIFSVVVIVLSSVFMVQLRKKSNQDKTPNTPNIEA